MSREKRCGVLFTSSAAAHMISPGFASYSATKHAVSCFGEAMFWELKRNIDVTVWEPGYIESNIHLEKPPGLLTLTAKQAVSDIFNKFGIRKTYGSLIFAMMPTMSADMGGVMKKEVDKKQDFFNQRMEEKEKEAQ